MSVCFALGVGVALAMVQLKARTFTTSFSFVPQASQDQSRAGLANLAGQLGVSIGAAAGGAQSPQLYADLLRTRETLEPIARDSFVLVPGGTTHDFENRSNARAGVLNLSIPGPCEEHMPGIADWFKAHPPEDA